MDSRWSRSDPGEWTRRGYLRRVGAAGLLALGGCAGDDGGETGTSTPTSSERVAVTATSVPTSSRTDHGGRTGTRSRSGPTTGTGSAPETDSGTRTRTASEPAPAEQTSTVDVDGLETELGSASFSGRLFDTHAHWHGARDAGHEILDPAALAERQAENDVGATALFVGSRQASTEYATVLETLHADQTEFLPFVQPNTRAHLVQGAVADVYERHREAFWGIGEIIFYGGPFEGTSLTADPWPRLFGFAADRDLALMIHPTQAQASGLKEMLAEYPEATVMAHGGEFNLDRETLAPILRDHPNLYWTLDAGSMLNGLVLRARDARDFAQRFDRRSGEYKQLVEGTLPWMMEAAPDRVMWGTDLATAWNTDPAVYSRVMTWTDWALNSLSPDRQEKYAAGNARALFDL